MNQFSTTRKILFGDCDPVGILYTPRIGYFVVESIMEYMSHCLGSPAEKKIIELNIFPPVKAYSVEFLKPMTWDEVLEISVSVKEIRNSAIVYQLKGEVKGAITFRSELTQVCVSKVTKQPIRVPDELRNALL